MNLRMRLQAKQLAKRKFQLNLVLINIQDKNSSKKFPLLKTSKIFNFFVNVNIQTRAAALSI
jgi:hypothetical protein